MNIPTVNIYNLDSNKLKLALTQYGRMLRNRKSFSQVEQEELQYLNQYKPLPKIDQRSILTKTADEFDQDEKDSIINSNLDLINMIEGIENSNEQVLEDLSIQSDYEKMYNTTTGITQIVDSISKTQPETPDEDTAPQDSKNVSTTTNFDGEHVLTTSQDIISLSPRHLIVTRSSQGYDFEEVDLNAEAEVLTEEDTQIDPFDPFDDVEDIDEESDPEDEWEEEEEIESDPEDEWEEEEEIESDPEDSQGYSVDNPFDDEPEIEDEYLEEEEEIESDSKPKDVFDDEDNLDLDSDDNEEETNPQPQDIIQEQYEQVIPKTQTASSKPISGVGRNIAKPVSTQPRHTTLDTPQKSKIPTPPVKPSPTIPTIPTPPVNTTKQRVADRLKSDYINNPEVIPREVKSFVTKYRGIKYSDAKMYISSKELDRSLKQGEVILKSNRLW